ncbi:MAG TPA: solute:sodium symporter family transporter, partial [Planctomycetaceae bacterium]
LFTGVLLLNLFYWCTNQQIIQRAFAATSLSQGQKGVLLAGFFKILAPVILVLPGIVAFHLYGRVSVDGEMVPVKEVTTTPVTVVARDGEREIILHGPDAEAAVGGRPLAEARSLESETVTAGGKELRVEAVLGPGVVVTEGPDGQNRYTEKGEADVVSPRLRDTAYGTLVRNVLPKWLAGFFAAVMAGAILSSFNSVLNSSATLFSLGVYKHMLRPNASDHEVVRSGMIFGAIVAVTAMLTAPLLAGQESIFAYLQKMNGLYFIPIFAVVLVGMFSRRVPAVAANVALVVGFLAIAAGYFIPRLSERVTAIHEFHFLGIVFVSLIALMLVIGAVRPRETPWEHRATGEVDLTPWRWAVPAGVGMVMIVLAIYVTFADPSVVAEPAAVAKP